MSLSQVISGYAERLGPYDGVSVCSPAGCVTSSLAGSFMYYGAFAVEVPLTARMQNPVEVCTFDHCGGRTCVHTAVNGEPLIIDQVATNS